MAIESELRLVRMLAGVELVDLSALDEVIPKLEEATPPARRRSDPTYIDNSTRVRHWAHLKDRLGPRYERCTFETFKASSQSHYAVEKVTAFMRDLPNEIGTGGGVTLYGPPGAGKDHLLAAGMFWAILRYGYSVRWVNGLDLYAEMRDRISSGDPESTIVADLCKPQILVISDPLPPKGEISRYNAETLYRVIDRRYRDLKSTWSTMNVDSGEEAQDRIAKNIVDRLRDNSLCLHCDWPSYRKAKP